MTIDVDAAHQVVLVVSDLLDGEVEKFSIDAEEPDAVGISGGETFAWGQEKSWGLRQSRQVPEPSASADLVRVYLQQIGKVPLLTAAEEVELARRIEAGLYADERLHRNEHSTEKLSPQLRRDLR
ncbi:MAG: RNA polymerase sigma factor, partial [Actinomycetota bacterium]|nr:RNA polymerase sigma factor [Actinomycetota bacterium]MDQ3905450.1 RNA polymerase sigma factor [Actinomycetota bacterium]